MTDAAEPRSTSSAADAPATDPTAGRGVPVVWVLGLAAIASSVAAIVVLERDAATSGGDWVRLVLAVAFSAAGIALIRGPLTRVLGIVTLAAATTGGFEFYASALLRTGDDAEITRAVESLAAAVLVALALHLLLVLADGRLAGPRARVAAGASYTIAVTVGILRWAQHPDPPAWPVITLAVVAGVVGFTMANRRYVTTRGPARQRMQWFGLASALCAETVLVAAGLHLLVGWPPNPVASAAASLVLVAGALTAAALPTFVSRIDRLLSHAVSAAGLTAVVTIIYLIVVIGLGRVPTEEDKDVLVLSMAAAAVSALVYPPARRRLTEVADRFVYGRHHDPADTLENFGARLTRAVPMDELLLQLAEQCTGHLDLTSADVWTGVGGHLTRTTSVPERDPTHVVLGPEELPVISRARVSGRSWADIWTPSLLEGLGSGPVRVVPLVHNAELFGLIVLERPEVADDFSDEEERILTELGREIALALHNSELDNALQVTLEEVQRANVDLRESRARLVAAADLERRRIERDLHDGAQQNLVALAVKLRLIRKLAEEDATAALAMVDEARAEALATIEELRALAHGIYPPLLMDRGLADALSAAAARSMIPTTVEADGTCRYPPEVEAAVYFCVLEALQNAGKYAGEGASITVSLEHTDGELRFSVRDDGAGFDLDAGATGHGFVNMTDRVGAIGGSVEVWSEPGRGTRIRGSVPIAGAEIPG